MLTLEGKLCRVGNSWPGVVAHRLLTAEPVGEQILLGLIGRLLTMDLCYCDRRRQAGPGTQIRISLNAMVKMRIT